MCTSIVVNRKKTIVGWNLDLLDMEYRVREDDKGVYIGQFLCHRLMTTADE